ncbi:MAG TPA: class I adenylate-forming enzyme family protein [Xanthobacteraceae bacterium]|nr:class I adenylate-forming enzyme family protein [Xanthobacteraceae bacterium]
MSRSAHIVDMIFFWARAEPHRLALIQPELVTSFQGLADAIESISERIDRLELDSSEPVAISIASPSYYLAAIFALLRCGFTVAPVNPPLFPHLRSAGIRNLIYDTHGQVLSGGRNIRFDASWLPAETSPASRKPHRDRPGGNGDMILFTSGTTGRPKAARQAMNGVVQRYNSPLSCANGDFSKALILPGLAGGFGFNRACEILYSGKTACFAPFGETALSLISTFGIEALVASTQHVLSLADLQAGADRYDLSSLKVLKIGGALLSPAAARRVKTNLCRNIIMSYASTEAGTAAIAPYDMIADIPGAVGFLSPEAEVQIVDSTGAVLPVGAEGIIRVRTPQIVSNLASGAAAQADSSSEWFYPGDIGRVTEAGVLCLAGRYSDVINRGGHKVSATKIEEVLEALPQIKEAAACGVQGPSELEEIWIAVVAQSPVDVSEIKRHLREHHDLGLDVDEVIEVSTLPRNDTGKVQKHLLKETLLRLKKGS